MSQGAIFNLILRDERFDRLLTASDYLRAWLDEVRLARERAGYANVQPKVEDVTATHTLYLRAAYRPYVRMASEYVKVMPSGDGASSLNGGTVEFSFPMYGHFTSDLVLRVRIAAVGSAVSGEAAAAAPRYRYCAYPGVRLLRRVALASDKVEIDSYEPDDVLWWAKLFLGASQLPGWDRCMGQQAVRRATYPNPNGWTGSLFYSDGPQTPKTLQPELELMIPLQFWLARDPGAALLNDLIPNTQRTVVLELAPLADIIQALTPDGAAAPLPAPPKIELELYVNNIFVAPEIHDLFASRVGFTLVRVHRRQRAKLTAPESRVLLSSLKWPAEFLAVVGRAPATALSFDQWWLGGAPAPRAEGSALLVPIMYWGAQPVPNAVPVGVCQLACREATDVSSLEPVLDAVGLTSAGVPIFSLQSALFYGSYLPNRYFQNGVARAASDPAQLLIPFCPYPGAEAPNGTFNLSTGRETYLDCRAATATPFAPVELYIGAAAINFLIRRGDSIALRYAL